MLGLPFTLSLQFSLCILYLACILFLVYSLQPLSPWIYPWSTVLTSHCAGNIICWPLLWNLSSTLFCFFLQQITLVRDVGAESSSKASRIIQSCPILPHCYGPLRAVNGPYVLHKPSLLLTVRMLSTYGAWISLLHECTMRYGSFDPYGPKTYGACISLLHQGTMPYGSFDPYSP